MPIVRIELLEGRPQEIKQIIANEMTDVLVRNFGVAPSQVYVIFADVPLNDWAVGGRFFESLPSPQKKTNLCA